MTNNDISTVDEINLNSDEEEVPSRVNGSAAKLELRSEPDDIFEDIPEPKEIKTEISASLAQSLEPALTSSRPLVRDLKFKHLYILQKT